MNERIRELAEEAYFDCDISTNIKIPKEFVEKFAELIVKECTEICLEMAAKCAGLPGDGALAKDCGRA